MVSQIKALDNSGVTQDLLNFLNNSTCNFTAVLSAIDMLESSGFTRIRESEEWKLKKGGKYFVVKNDTAIFAFIIGEKEVENSGFKIISAHTDSPCFKLKPHCEIYGDGGVVSLNVEKYGGGIMSTWFDRPLSIAGRVLLRSGNALKPTQMIIDLHSPVATIPNLAIHFNRQVNDGYKLSVQKDMKPVIGYFSPDRIDEYKKNGGLIAAMLCNHINDNSPAEKKISPSDILDYELCLYPAEKAALCGINDEFIQSARIDDLSMAYCGLAALLKDASYDTDCTRIIALFDNEETGSGTKQGAASPVLRHIAERICISLSDSSQCIYRSLSRSFMISADDAHGWHPNYNDKYDPTNHPVLGGGPVVKINANCKYMTDGRGAAVFHALCEEAGVKMQYFVNHGDVAGGSTLGNISSSQLDIEGVDVGCAIWAMHSARETAAVSDHIDMIKVFRQFLK
ncbi:MAG: M18 family aminopeptidase [Muribaculaceae bacterium]|nr:M18 family aminopeptidase [Muribaculaceae bacterium]